MVQNNEENKPINSLIGMKAKDLANKLNIDLSRHLKEGTLDLHSFVEEVSNLAPNLTNEISRIIV
jgi:hypothetical protein